MSLKFAHTGSSDRVDLTNTGTDPTVGTIYLWVLNYGLVAGAMYFAKGGPTGSLIFGSGAGTAHRLQLGIDYTTTDIGAVSADQTLLIGIPQFVCCTFNGANSLPRLYVGTQNKVPMEPVPYTSQTLAVGTRVTDAGAVVKIGNRATHTNSPQAYIELVNYIDGAVLSRDEVVEHWEEARAHPLSKFFGYLGDRGNGSQYDLTGLGNNGTTTGCIVGPKIFEPGRRPRQVFGDVVATSFIAPRSLIVRQAGNRASTI